MTQEIKADLQIGGVKVDVGHEFLYDIARFLPDIAKNKKVFEVLASSSNYEVREEIADKEHLSKKTIAALINDDDHGVVNKILSNMDAGKRLTIDQINGVIEKGVVRHLCTIADNVENFQEYDGCKLIDKLINHGNSKVKYNLLEFYSADQISKQQLRKLAEDEDADVVSKAKEELSDREN